MEKKTFETPALEIVELQLEDILRVSRDGILLPDDYWG